MIILKSLTFPVFALQVVSSTNGELAPEDPGGQSNTPITAQPDVEINDETKYVFITNLFFFNSENFV